MNNWRRSLFPLICVVAMATSIAASWTFTANAHCAYHVNCPNGDHYYPRHWKPSHHPGDSTINWKFTANFPSTALRDRVKDGAVRWNNKPQEMGFEFKGEGPQFVRDCPNLTNPYSGVFYEYLDGTGGTNAFTWRCWHDGKNTMHDFQIIFDRDELWYTGTTNPPFDTVDAFSLAVHEFGHALGFRGPYANGHFDPNSAVCNGQDQPEQTMCPWIAYGDTNWRTLEIHDEHTFDNAYD